MPNASDAGHRVGAALRAIRGRLTGRQRAVVPDPSRGDRGQRTRPAAAWSLARYSSFLPAKKRRRVAVLVPDGVGQELATVIEEFEADQLYVLSPASSPDWELGASRAVLLMAETVGQLNWLLKSIGPVDVIVDLWSARSADGTDVWRTLFFHLRRGGVYVLANHTSSTEVPTGDSRPPGAVARVGTFLRRHWNVEESAGSESAELPAAETELLASCARFLIDRSFLLVEKRQTHYVKLRDSEVARFLPQRNTRDTVSVLDTLPKGELEGRGTVVSHESAVPISGLPDRVSYPELHLHHYEGKFGLVINSLLYGDSTVVPASFRYPVTRTLSNPRLNDVSPDFARLPDQLRPRRKLPGVYYHLDAWNPGHFGHIITEVVSRLWGWHQAKAAFPELKAIFRRRFPNERHPGLELSLFTAYGIDPDDIVWVDEPVWLSSVVAATPMWQNDPPYYVHPEIETTWRRLRSLVGSPAGRARKIFVSRRATLTNRSCRNIAEVEEVFRRHGFAVVFPEELDFAEQATAFGAAEVVAGLAGSGLYNILYSGRLQTLIVLGHEAYTARYEHLYTMVLGCTTHYFWSTPDVPHPTGGWRAEAYYSAWEFDFDRNGIELEEVLNNID